MNKRLTSTILFIILLTGFYCLACGQDTVQVLRQNRYIQSSQAGISSDDFVFRVGYAYGPEYLFLLLPPVKLGVEYHMPNRNVYVGLDASLTGTAALWIQTGLYTGLKHKNLTLETKINHLIAASPDAETLKIWSINPKIGIDYRKFYLKIGPYFPVHSYGSLELNEKIYVSLGGILLNFDIGFRFPSNKN